MTYLQQVDGQQQRQRGRVLKALIAGLALLLILVGGGVTWLLMRDPAGARKDATASSAAASTAVTAVVAAPSTSSAAAVTDPGELACARLDVKSTDWKALQALGEQAAKGTDEGVVFWGKLLRSSAEIAVYAQGQPDETKRETAAAAAAEDLRKACAKAGYIDA